MKFAYALVTLAILLVGVFALFMAGSSAAARDWPQGCFWLLVEAVISLGAINLKLDKR